MVSCLTLRSQGGTTDWIYDSLSGENLTNRLGDESEDNSDLGAVMRGVSNSMICICIYIKVHFAM